MKTLNIIFYLCIILFSSCKKSISEVSPKNEIDKIIIEFRPSFILPCTMVLDLSQPDLLFHRIGAKAFYKFRPYPEIAKEVKAPQSIYFRLDAQTEAYLKDSILFSETDFVDRDDPEVLDGIGNSIIYIFKNGEMRDIDLSNSHTQNQQVLFQKLIDECISHSSDSLTSDYLKRLKGYYD